MDIKSLIKSIRDMKWTSNTWQIVWGLLSISGSIVYGKVDYIITSEVLKPIFTLVSYILAGTGVSFISLGILGLILKYIITDSEQV